LLYFVNVYLFIDKCFEMSPSELILELQISIQTQDDNNFKSNSADTIVTIDNFENIEVILIIINYYPR